MKYDLYINQRAIIENGFDLDLADGAIMDFLRFFSSSNTCLFLVEDGKRYYWFSHKIICDQLPILKLKPDSAYRRMKALCEKSFLKAHPQNKQKNASWYAFEDLADALYSTIGKKSDGKVAPPQTIGVESEPSEQNPMGIGAKSVGPSEQNPMYKEIKDKEEELKDITIIIKGEGDENSEKKDGAEVPEVKPEVQSESLTAVLLSHQTNLKADKEVVHWGAKSLSLTEDQYKGFVDRFFAKQISDQTERCRIYGNAKDYCYNWIQKRLEFEGNPNDKRPHQNGSANNGSRGQNNARPARPVKTTGIVTDDEAAAYLSKRYGTGAG